MGWVIISCLLCLVLAVLLYLKQGAGEGAGGRAGGRPQEAAARGPGGRRVGGGRMRPRREEQEEIEQERRQEEEEEREELEETLGKSIDGNVGKKKMQKLQDKAEKKKQREAEQKEREENKKRREALDEQERKEREKEKEEDNRIEEEERLRREEKERKEHEEYLALKAAFSVEEEGCDAGEEGEEENLLLKFINYVKETKVQIKHSSRSQSKQFCFQVVKLEDLAAHFKLKTQEAIDRVNTLLADGLLTGGMTGSWSTPGVQESSTTEASLYTSARRSWRLWPSISHNRSGGQVAMECWIFV